MQGLRSEQEMRRWGARCSRYTRDNQTVSYLS